MNNGDEIFDKKMKAEFKNETNNIPKDINEEFDNILRIQRKKEKINLLKIKRVGIAAASFVCVTTLVMQTAFAQDIVNKIVKSLSIKGLTVYENNTVEKKGEKDIPESAKGKIFDKDGKSVNKINADNMNYLYNSEGEHVWVDDDGMILTVEEKDKKQRDKEQEYDDSILTIRDLNHLNKHISFEVQLPEYIPEGYEFTKAECENYEKDGFDNSFWYSLDYENKDTGKLIHIQLTQIIDDVQNETFFDNIEKGDVNGNEAIISNKSISWSNGKVQYMLIYDDIGKDEGMKIAKSIK